MREGDLMRVLSVCVGPAYSADWVLKLKRMVERQVSFTEFCCITDKQIDGVTCIEPEPGLPGWWQKVALFKPGRFNGDNLYFDLDVVITGSLDFLSITDPEKLHVRDDFSYSVRSPKSGHWNPQLGYHGAVNSSVMLWRGDSCRAVWDEFTPEVMNFLHGDQNFITRVLHPKRQIVYLPEDEVLSYKYHIMRGRKPTGVVVFHGEPKVTQLPKADPLRQIWES